VLAAEFRSKAAPAVPGRLGPDDAETQPDKRLALVDQTLPLIEFNADAMAKDDGRWIADPAGLMHPCIDDIVDAPRG